jgi:hypothetical protein
VSPGTLAQLPHLPATRVFFDDPQYHALPPVHVLQWQSVNFSQRRVGLDGFNLRIQYEGVAALLAWRHLVQLLDRGKLSAGFLSSHLAPRRVSHPPESDQT